MRRPDDDLDALLLSAAPGHQDAAEEDRVFADAWSRVQASLADDDAGDDELQRRRLDLIADRQVGARRRRRATRVASLTLAVALAGAGTAAAATEFLSTRTGEHLTGWEVDAGGSGEVLNLDGTDRGQVFDQVTKDIPFPPGYGEQRDYALGFYPAEAAHAVTDGTLRSFVARMAVCTWADAWVAADGSGDQAARQAATTTLADAVSWPDIRDNDYPDNIITETGQHVSYNYWVPLLAEGAGAGDRQAVLDAVADSYACSYQVLPVIDTVPDYRYAGVR
jgi:hypothetical protein